MNSESEVWDQVWQISDLGYSRWIGTIMGWLNANAPVVQTVASVFAFFIAISVPLLMLRNEIRKRDHENRAKGQAVAVLVEPVLRSHKREIERMSKIVGKPEPIELPQQLLSRSNDFWRMGKAGAATLRWTTGEISANLHISQQDTSFKSRPPSETALHRLY